MEIEINGQLCPKRQCRPIQIREADHPAVKDCIK